MERRTTAAGEEAKKISQHVGQVGERLTVTLTGERWIVLGENSFSPYGGSIYLVKMRDDMGNLFVWRGSGGRSLPGEGETLTVTFTVKSHAVYQDENQTFIERPRAVMEKR